MPEAGEKGDQVAFLEVFYVGAARNYLTDSFVSHNSHILAMQVRTANADFEGFCLNLVVFGDLLLLYFRKT